ncbi:MAG: hypothetical protein LBS49_11825 [Candidatus Accumulibacter sp.]|nr:hypothetical protein [Accumulibacter sp.]
MKQTLCGGFDKFAKYTKDASSPRNGIAKIFVHLAALLAFHIVIVLLAFTTRQ